MKEALNVAKKMLMARDYKLKINRYFNNDFKAFLTFI